MEEKEKEEIEIKAARHNTTTITTTTILAYFGREECSGYGSSCVFGSYSTPDRQRQIF